MSEQRWLVVLMDGVSPDDLALGATPWLDQHFQGASRVDRLHLATGRPAADQLLDDLPAGLVRDLGLEVDQRSLVLRSRNQSDNAIMRQLPHRQPGPADLTVLWLRDHARAANEFGLHTEMHRDALRQLERHVQIAHEYIGSAGRVKLVLLTAGPLQPVSRTFDPIGVLRQRLGHGLRKRCSIHRRLSHLKIISPSVHDSRHIASLLVSTPFQNYGRIVSAEEKLTHQIPIVSGEIIYVPHEGVAFAQHLIHAAPRFLAADPGSAVLPWITDQCDQMDLAQVGRGLLTCLQQAVESHAPEAAPTLENVLEAADLTPLTLPLEAVRTEP